MENKNCWSVLIARKMIEAIYGQVQDSYEVKISVDEYEQLREDERDDWYVHEYCEEDCEESEIFSYARLIDRKIWFGNISNDYGYIKDREEILKLLDVETVKYELRMRYNALWELQYRSYYMDDNDKVISIELVREIVMWTRNGFIS